MTEYLLDTNVISETAKRNPDERVIEWIRSLPLLRLPAVGLYEIATSVKRVPSGRRRHFLEGWLGALLASGCEVLPLDREAALASADLDAAARAQRRVIEHRDVLILGTAKARAIGVATRNVAHFRGLGVPLYDPFADVRNV